MAIPAEALQTMQEQFQNRVRTDTQLNRIRKKIQNGGTFADAEQYGIRSGQLLSKTLKENITADLFDDGEPLEASNLASAIIPMMEQNYGYVSNAASAVQKTLNSSGGLGLNPVQTEFDRSTAMNVVGRMANYDSFEDAEWMLDEPIVSNSISTVDRTMHDNAEFQYRSGLKPKIVRTCESGACEWCQDLEGEYDYEEVKERNSPVYQRHNNCQCEITFEPGDGRVQDVYSKQWYDEDSAKERIASSKKEDSEYQFRSELEKDARRYGATQPDFYVGLNGKALPAEYKEWIGDNKMQEFIHKCESAEASKVIKSDFRPTSFIGDGDTASIRLFEKKTGLNCGRNGRTHEQKVNDLIRQIEKALLLDLPPNDKIMLQERLEGLLKVK